MGAGAVRRQRGARGRGPAGRGAGRWAPDAPPRPFALPPPPSPRLRPSRLAGPSRRRSDAPDTRPPPAPGSPRGAGCQRRGRDRAPPARDRRLPPAGLLSREAQRARAPRAGRLRPRAPGLSEPRCRRYGRRAGGAPEASGPGRSGSSRPARDTDRSGCRPPRVPPGAAGGRVLRALGPLAGDPAGRRGPQQRLTPVGCAAV